MTTTTLDFRTMTPGELDLDDVRARYAAVVAEIGAASDERSARAALQRWDTLRKEVETWSALVSVRFEQDTRDPARDAARKRLDEVRPHLEEMEVSILRRLLGHPRRPMIEGLLGRHVFRLWDCRARSFDPVIADDMVEEASLTAEYTALVASAQFTFEGESLNLAQLARYDQHPDRRLRHEAARRRWGFFGEHGGVFDRIYDSLVRIRERMASKLGFAGFTPLGYDRMARTDYGPKDVAAYRRQILDHVVPLCAELKERQRERLGLDELMVWDEALQDPRGNPRPRAGSPGLHAAARAMFDEMGAGLGPFFRMMEDAHLLDLESRPGKASGGFCTFFPSHGVPFIFANFNGTKDDVDVFTHEMGHAYQAWLSRERFPMDLQSPTAEACEVHSMSLELLTGPWMEGFFGEDAERYRRIHLVGSFVFLPYGAAIDEFQHRVFEEPGATPARRHEIWKELEALYLPWRRWGDLEAPGRGISWQRQLHVYRYPFYYVDYTLAQVCAFQFWSKALRDRARAMEDYVALCRRGGEAPFGELLRATGLESPFAPGSLERVVGEVRRTLAL